jgi:heptosyltransferase-2
MNLIKYENISKILIIRLSSMGDVILTTALVRQLRKSFPEARIDFAVSKQFSDIVKYNPHLSNIFEYDKSLKLNEIKVHRNEFLRRSHSTGYDIVVDLQNNLRSKHFSKGIAPVRLTMNKRRLFKLALVHFKKLINPPVHVADMYHKTAGPLGTEDDGDGTELWLPEESRMEDYPPRGREIAPRPRKIAFAPAAHHYSKRWPADRFARLADNLAQRFDVEIATFGGPGDKEICLFISSIAETKIRDYSGALSIVETTRRLSEYDLLITNDTGVMHIASARRMPVVAIFGSTVPELGFAPWRTTSQIVQKDMACRPCTHIGRSNCPQGHFDCMGYIEPEEVAKAAEEIFGSEK